MASRILARPKAILRPWHSTQPSTVWSRRLLTTTAPRYLKEDADRSGEEVERKKQEQVDKQKRGEGHWHEELASQGESNIAADKQEVKNHDDHIGKLQEETKEKGDKGEI